MTPEPTLPHQAVHVFEADAFWVRVGMNQGDAIDVAGVSQPGDVYQLDPDARPRRLLLADGGPNRQRVAPGSEIGAPGDEVALVARHLLMTPEGDEVDLLMLRLGRDRGLLALPLSPVAEKIDYTLVESRDDPGEARIRDLVCVAFTPGTMITMGGGEQRPIETLTAGDMVLTRDSGPQPVRLLAKATMRAIGSWAPVVISAGTLGNEGDLVVSPHHRVFLYRRGENRIGATPELLVQARHLIDGEHVWRREGGYVDYYALVFDRHEIVYAEGIPVESLMVTEATLNLLPEEQTAEIRARLPGLRHAPHVGSEPDREAISRLRGARLFSGPPPRRDGGTEG